MPLGPRLARPVGGHRSMDGFRARERCAVGDPGVSRNLPKRLPDALTAKGAVAVDWTDGLWKEVDGVRRLRNRYVHWDLTEEDLFAELAAAEGAIAVLRRGLIDLCSRAQKAPPEWVACDKVPDRLGGSSAWLMVSSAGADGDPGAIRIAAVFGGAEWDTALLRSDEEPWSRVAELLSGVRVPLTAVRLYRGDKELLEIPVGIRGA